MTQEVAFSASTVRRDVPVVGEGVGVGVGVGVETVLDMVALVARDVLVLPDESRATAVIE